MIATACVRCRTGTARGGGIVGVVDVLVIAVDNRGHARSWIRRDAEVVVEVAIAGTADAAFTDTAVVVDRCRLYLREGAARGRRAQVLREEDVPGRAHRIIVRRVHTVIVGGAVPDDIKVSGVVGDAPRHDGRGGRGSSVDLNGRGPRCAMIGRIAIEQVVVV